MQRISLTSSRLLLWACKQSLFHGNWHFEFYIDHSSIPYKKLEITWKIDAGIYIFNPYNLMIKEPFLWLLNFEKFLFWPSHMELPVYLWVPSFFLFAFYFLFFSSSSSCNSMLFSDCSALHGVNFPPKKKKEKNVRIFQEICRKNNLNKQF